MDIKWYCPRCNEQNTDDPKVTAVPMCSECEKNTDWWLILPEGIEFDGEVFWSTCAECGHQQGDMGNNVRCESCGYGPMPTMDS